MARLMSLEVSRDGNCRAAKKEMDIKFCLLDTGYIV